MIKVMVAGCTGRMGTAVVEAVDAAEDMELVAGVALSATGQTCGAGEVPIFDTVEEAIEATQPDVMVDFTQPNAVEANLRAALPKGVHCVVGTTGLNAEQLANIAECANGAILFYAPNFTTCAVLMMQFAKMAAAYFPDVEIIELHHDRKKDAPSGTAAQTAKLIAENRKGQQSKAPGKETEMPGMEGARGALVEQIPVHSVRSAGYVAHQEVIFGSAGQTLTIRHDSIARASYMPGVLLAVRNVQSADSLVIGLENFMD